jgi:hypothetical protein
MYALLRPQICRLVDLLTFGLVSTLPRVVLDNGKRIDVVGKKYLLDFE